MFGSASNIKSLLSKGVISTAIMKNAAKPSKGHQECHSHADKYKKICLFGVFPGLFCVAIGVFSSIHEHERQPFVKYDYLRIRTKRFPWGDGTKSFYHNPKINPLPDGYED